MVPGDAVLSPETRKAILRNCPELFASKYAILYIIVLLLEFIAIIAIFRTRYRDHKYWFFSSRKEGGLNCFLIAVLRVASDLLNKWKKRKYAPKSLMQ